MSVGSIQCVDFLRSRKEEKSMATHTEGCQDRLYSIHTGGHAEAGTLGEATLLDYVQSIHDMGIACLKLRGMKPVRLECIGKGLHWTAT